MNIDYLIQEVSNLEKKKVEDYLLRFYTKSNLNKYEINPLADKEEIKATRVMFESKKNLKTRCDLAFEYDPLCLEALLAYMSSVEDIYISYRFESYLKQDNNFADFSVYQKQKYLKILELYIDFLLDIHNITTAIKVEKILISLSGGASKSNINHLSFMYSTLENYLDFYMLYLQSDFSTYDYILLLVTLLKNDEELKAKQVLMDMEDKIKYTSYLDHLWDLNLKDPEQKEFYDTVEDCYLDIASVPYFFSWVSNCIKDNQSRK